MSMPTGWQGETKLQETQVCVKSKKILRETTIAQQAGMPSVGALNLWNKERANAV